MAAMSFTTDFEGYWSYKNRGYIPDKSGVYCVYSGKLNQSTNKVTLRKLIYIGESYDVRQRLQNHETLDEWKKYLQSGEDIWFSFASVESAYRVRVEAALINHHKPPVNVEYKENFPYDTTKITTKGANALLSSVFTVYESARGLGYGTW